MTPLSILPNLHETEWDALAVVPGEAIGQLTTVARMPQATANGKDGVYIEVTMPDGKKHYASTTLALFEGALAAFKGAQQREAERNTPEKPKTTPAPATNGLTTDTKDPGLVTKRPVGGQFQKHLVLSEEERAKGYVRPVRRSYVHTGNPPTGELRDLTDQEKLDYAACQYVKFETYPADPSRPGIIGRFLTERTLKGGCGALTTMPLAIAETYARQPSFYGSTFCCGCQAYHPVEEFTWEGTDERVGS